MRRSGPAVMVWFALMIGLPVAADASIEDRILDQAVDVRVEADGRLDITERIEVRTEGGRFRHGIVHTLPTRPRDPQDRLRTADVEVLEVLRDGQPEPWTRRRVAGATQLQIGDDRHLAMPSQPVYTLRYRLDRQIGVVDGDAVLQLDALHADQGIPVERGSVTIGLPRAVPVAALHASGAPVGGDARARDHHVAKSAAGSARWTLVRPLPPGDALRITLAFPGDVVVPPTRRQQVRWWMGDNAPLLLALAGAIALSGLCLLCWRRRRVPASGAATTPDTSTPAMPPGFSPGGLRYMTRMRYDARCATADLLAAAVHAHLRIARTPGDGAAWRLERIDRGATTLPTLEERALLHALPSRPQTSGPPPTAASSVHRALDTHVGALRRRFQPALFRASAVHLLVAVAIALACAGPAVMLGVRADTLGQTLVALSPMLPLLVAVGVLARAPTREGFVLLQRVDRLRAQLTALPGAAGPAPDAMRYAALLPAAVALDAEDAWTHAFVGAVGHEAATAAIAGWPWLDAGPVDDAPAAIRSLVRGLTLQIAATAGPHGTRRHDRERKPDPDRTMR